MKEAIFQFIDRRFFLIALFLIIFRLFVSPLVWHPDVGNHVDWGARFYSYTPEKFYAPDSNVWNFTWPNQPPGSIYIYAFITKVYEAVFAFVWSLNVNISFFPSFVVPFFERNLIYGMLKLPAITADILLTVLVFKITKSRLSALTFLALPPIWYNSSVWGQTDSIVNFFALVSIYFATKDRLFLSIFMFAISLYIKLSMAIFAPILILILLRKSLVKSISYSALVVILIIVFSLPFSTSSNPLIWIRNIYVDRVLTEQMQVVSANAFNLWGLIFGSKQESHYMTFFGFSYQLIGNLVFAFMWLTSMVFYYISKNRQSVYIALTLTALCSFMLMTNMHERYLYPVFAPMLIVAFYVKKIRLSLLMLTLINVFNLYNLWWVPELGLVTSFMKDNQDLVFRSMSLISMALFFRLYFILNHQLLKIKS
jgi:Gpi18-like mannosyltransferase